MHNSLFINKCMLRYYPRHVSSINMHIFRRKNFIHTASGIVALCKRLHSMPDESRLLSSSPHFLEQEASLQFSNKRAIFRYPESDESGPNSFSVFSRVLYITIAPSTTISLSGFPTQTPHTRLSKLCHKSRPTRPSSYHFHSNN